MSDISIHCMNVWHFYKLYECLSFLQTVWMSDISIHCMNVWHFYKLYECLTFLYTVWMSDISIHYMNVWHFYKLYECLTFLYTVWMSDISMCHHLPLVPSSKEYLQMSSFCPLCFHSHQTLLKIKEKYSKNITINRRLGSLGVKVWLWVWEDTVLSQIKTILYQRR